MNQKKSLQKQAVFAAGILALSALMGSFVYAQRPKTILATIDQKEVTIVTDQETVRDALVEANITDLEGADVSVPLSTEVSDEMQLTVNTEKNVTLVDGGVSKSLDTTASTVGELLRAENVTADTDDIIEPARVADITEGMTITVDHIDTTQETRTEEVPFTSRTEETDEWNIGRSEVVTAGVPGVREIVTRVVTKNGEEIERTEVSNEITKQPVEEVVRKGTHDPTPRSPKLYTLGQFQFQGVVYYSGYKYTFYSQSVLPGGGLRIPGRHVNADGYVADGDGYIVLAGSAAKGTVFPTPFGYYGKIYDRGTSGNHLDVYVR